MASILLLCARHFLHRIEVTVRKKVLKKQRNIFFSTWAHGVVVSHPLSMREALGSIPSVSKFCLGTFVAFGNLTFVGVPR